MQENQKFTTPEEMQGCGKLSHTLITRLTKNSLPGASGTIHKGASKCEILSVIYLSQIADSSGFISQFKITDLAKVIGCTVRSTYNIMENLKSKGFVTFKYYDNINWSGIKDIRLINNDFSKTTKFTGKNRYVSSFQTCFDFTSHKSYAFMHSLSLYALRTLLIILDIYNYKHGAKISCKELADRLEIKDNTLVLAYMNELRKYYGANFFSFQKNTSPKKDIYGFILIHPGNYFFVAPGAPAEQQLTYYKRKWLLFFQNNGIEYQQLYRDTMMSSLNYLFSLIYAALKENRTLTHQMLEEKLKNFFLDYFHWDLLTISRAIRFATTDAPPGSIITE